MKAQKKTLALALMVGMSFGQVMALAEDDVLNSAPINVDGYLHDDRPVTDGELEGIRSELGKQKNMTQLNKEKAKELGKLSGQTEKLLDSQDEYIDGKIESQKAIKEFNKKTAENEKKLKCLLEESTAPECAKWVKKSSLVEDQVSTGQAAPAAQIEAAAPAANGPRNAFEEIKLLPYAGVTNFQGEAEKLETEFAGGVRIESNVTERFSMGVGINFGQFTTQDYANLYAAQPFGFGYNNLYGSAREIKYSNVGLDLYGKFFITRGERFRPYVGAGIGYSRMTLEYGDNNQYSFGNLNFGKEELTSSYATGSLSAGTEILITRSIGLNVEFQYSRGFGASNSDSGVNPFNAPDQRRLQELGDEIIQSNALSIFAGVMVVF
ncbi:MAG: outer membrane beta-barrel protein [Bacteriovoracia bacterium]